LLETWAADLGRALVLAVGAGRAFAAPVDGRALGVAAGFGFTAVVFCALLLGPSAAMEALTPSP